MLGPAGRSGGIAGSMGSKEDASVTRARSIGLQALQRIARSGPVVHVHSSYRGALNLATSRGLVSIVPNGAGRGPLNINVDDGVMKRLWPLPTDERAVAMSGRIRFPRRLLLLLDCEVYDPPCKFASRTGPLRVVRRNLRAAQNCAIKEGRLEGMGALLPRILDGGGSPTLNPFSAAAVPHVRALLSAIRSGDLGTVHEASSHLIGLGVGLTPSGDDLLSGLMASLVLGSQNGLGPGDASKIVSHMVKGGKGRTTRLSFDYLQQASKGRVNELVRALVEGIFTEDERKVIGEALRTISIGETSGTDTLVGVCLGVQTILESRGPSRRLPRSSQHPAILHT